MTTLQLSPLIHLILGDFDRQHPCLRATLSEVSHGETTGAMSANQQTHPDKRRPEAKPGRPSLPWKQTHPLKEHTHTNNETIVINVDTRNGQGTYFFNLYLSWECTHLSHFFQGNNKNQKREGCLLWHRWGFFFLSRSCIKSCAHTFSVDL